MPEFVTLSWGPSTIRASLLGKWTKVEFQVAMPASLKLTLSVSPKHTLRQHIPERFATCKALKNGVYQN